MIILILLGLSFGCVRQNKTPPAAPVTSSATPGVTPVASPTPGVDASYVTDYANVIDAATETRLKTRLAQLRQQENMDFAVVTLSNLGAESAFDYSLRLARERAAVIQNNNDNGNLLLLVAVDDRQWHIQITRNLEPLLTNTILTELSTPMTDSFKQKQYGEGITKYVNAIIAKLAELRSRSSATPAK